MKNYPSEQNRLFLAFVSPALIFLFLLTTFPIAVVLLLSFFRYYLPERKAVFVGLENFITILHDKIFWQAFKNTAIFTIGSVFLHFVIGMTLALLLNVQVKGINNKIRNIFRGLFFSPWLLPSIVVAVMFLLILHPSGYLNYLLRGLGVINAPKTWLGDPRLAMFSVIMINGWKFGAFFMVMILGGLQGIPIELGEAAKVDGANVVQGFIYITLPQLKGVILTTTLLDTIWTALYFDLIYLTTGGGPLRYTEVLATYSYKVAFEGLMMGYAGCIGVVMASILFVFGIFYILLFQRAK
jgi:multiple sugar transport system permease protein